MCRSSTLVKPKRKQAAQSSVCGAGCGGFDSRSSSLLISARFWSCVLSSPVAKRFVFENAEELKNKQKKQLNKCLTCDSVGSFVLGRKEEHL